MEIRSVTLFDDLYAGPTAVEPFITAARTAFSYPLQSIRLATPPLPDWWSGSLRSLNERARQWQAAGVQYVSVGPVQLRHEAAWLNMLPALFASNDSLFASVEIADTNGRIDLARCQQIGQLIQQVAQLSPDGFGNLYLTAVANCPPGSPFFPVAYHGGGPAHFAIAVQAADLALQAFSVADNLEQARHYLVDAIETAVGHISQTANQLAADYGIPFSGIDFSLAPFPSDEVSLAAAMEALGVPFVGASGALFAAGFITEAIERARFPRCGFSGLMLPVLEDSRLARRAEEGVLSLADLLSYSAVCGVGLDTIPLPGDTSPAQLTAVLLDVAMLASRLHKPLTARLMPLPGLQAGDPVQFDFPYFANSRVMSIAGSGVHGRLAQPSQIQINPILEKKQMQNKD